MPHSGRILWRDVIPSAGGPRRAYRTRGLRMRHGIIFRSRTGPRLDTGQLGWTAGTGKLGWTAGLDGWVG